MDLNQVTKAYLKMRDKRTETRRAYEDEDDKLKGQMEILEAVMLKHLLDNGMESVKTTAGTFYKQESLKPSGSDWEALYDWIKETDAFDILERRIKAAFVKEHMETHEGALPPGVSVHRVNEVRVRRA